MILKRRLLLITILYWVLLVYIIAALIWWFIALEQQNTEMLQHRLSELVPATPEYSIKYRELVSAKERNTTQYVAEGVTFLLLIIVGAVFMYRAVRRQFTIQRQQENFMMAITHELKTPIAVARLNLETLQKHQLDESKRQKLVSMTLQETSRLDNLVTNILVSAQLESGRKQTREEVNFSDLVKTSADAFRLRFPNYDWKVEIEEEVGLVGDPLLLRILVNNLLENSVKYSSTGSTIFCSLKQNDGYVYLKIADHGLGIPAPEKKKVFGKFYRIGREETRSTKGTGLGLYLCKKIADDHDASIRIEDNTPAGSIFTVKFINKSVR